MIDPYFEQNREVWDRPGTALVFGAESRIGKALVRWALPRRFFRVVALTSKDYDVARADQVEAALDTHRPSVVFNASTWETREDAPANATACYRRNHMVPSYIAQSCKRRRIRLVHFSSADVFPPRGRPWAEHEAPRPVSEYGASLLEGERQVLETSLRENLVVRVGGELCDPQLPCFVRSVLQRARVEDPLRFVPEELGTLTWAPPAAQAGAELVRIKQSGVVHVAPPDEATWKDLAKAVFTEAGMHASIVDTEDESFSLSRARLRCDRLAQLRLPPLPAWRTALSSFFAADRKELYRSLAEEEKEEQDFSLHPGGA